MSIRVAWATPHPRPPLKLSKVVHVVDVIGGRRAIAELCGVGLTAVSNWCVWNRFPARLHLRLSRAVADRGGALAAELFGETEAA